jgi:protein-disulfide isomerase
MIGDKGNCNVGARGAILALVATLGFGGLLLPACSAQPQSAAATGKAMGGDQVVAKVMGEKVTQGELEKEAAGSLEQVDMQLLSCQANAEAQRHQVLEGTLAKMVQDKIVAAEAKQRGVTSEELIAAEVTSKIAEVTDADVDAFYTEKQAQIRRPKEQVAPQIKQFLASQRHDEVYGKFLDGLEKKFEVVVLLEPPRKEVAPTGPAKGPADAPITIVEFSDFECPFCSRVVPTLDKVREEYGDKVRLVFRQFPLSIHPNAQKAAEASLCADEQGKFWEMHDKMFADQKGLAVDSLKAKAAELGLDGDSFNQCLDTSEYAEAVKADLKAGAVAGVSGTPAMFVNGIFISGAVPYEQVAKVIDEELARKSAQAN